jgi:LysR family hydrogen peroxide-inducible transcriptional activator
MVCDGLATYRAFFRAEQHRVVGKGSGQTSKVESVNTKWRQRQSGLVRHSCGASHRIQEDLMERVRYFEEPQPVREIGIVTTDHFVRMALLQSLMEEVGRLVPESMRVQKKGRKVLRIQSAKL